MSSQIRLGERLPILGRLGGDITVVEPLTVKDLGVGGATIETRFPLVIDSLHEIRLVLADRAIVAKARVVHSHISDVDSEKVAYQSGVEFVDLPTRVRDVIERYMENLKTARGD